MEVDVPQPPKPNVTQQAGDSKPPVLKKFPDSKSDSKSTVLMVLIAFAVVGLGILTGWFLSGTKASTSSGSGDKKAAVTTETKNGGKASEEGQLDEEIKYQEAQGKLVAGGIKGEGTHHIERDNNTSRYVYLSSTVIDLDKYVDKEVQIWGETLSSTNAPWLMDVVKIKVVD